MIDLLKSLCLIMFMLHILLELLMGPPGRDKGFNTKQTMDFFIIKY